MTRVRKVLDWLREIFDGTRYPWFRKDYLPPSTFSDVDVVHVRGERPRPKALD